MGGPLPFSISPFLPAAALPHPAQCGTDKALNPLRANPGAWPACAASTAGRPWTPPRWPGTLARSAAWTAWRSASYKSGPSGALRVKAVRFEVDGEPVAATLHEPAGPARGQVVLVHGLLSRALEFGGLPARLAQRGWRVLALDQRGFGASGGARGIVTQERATADVLAGVAFLRRDAPNLPVALVGHSMGAVFALRALAEDPRIRAGVLAAPMDTVRGELSSPEFAMYRVVAAASRITSRTFLGPVKVPYKYSYDRLFHDKAAVARAKADPFLHPTVDLTNYPAFMAMQASVEAPRVTQPVLVLLGEHDRAVKRESSMRVYDALGGPKELAVLGCGHSVWSDCRADEAAAHVERWLETHLRV